MNSSTLGDAVEYHAARTALRLLQMTAFTMWCVGWGLSRAGPGLLSYADKLKQFAVSRLDEGSTRNGSPNSKSERFSGDANKHIDRGSGVPPPKIKKPLVDDEAKGSKSSKSEAQPDNEAKVQIKPLSMESGPQSETSEVTSPKPVGIEEPDAEVDLSEMDAAIEDIETQLDKRNHSVDEDGSIPSSAKPTGAESP